MTRRLSNPEQLVDERVRFKKSGEFDRLRRELLAGFQQSERLQSRVCEIARQRLASDPDLVHLAPDVVYRELVGELDRYPVLERAVAEAPLDPTLGETVRASLERILGSSSADRGHV